LTECNQKLRVIGENEALSSTETMSALESEMTKIMFRAFGKVTFNRSETHYRNKKIDVLQKEKVSLKEGKKFEELVVVEKNSLMRYLSSKELTWKEKSGI